MQHPTTDHSRRHQIVWKTARPVAKAFFKAFLNFDAGKVPPLEGPHLVLINHVTDFDPFMVCGSFPQHMYFLASEHIYRMGFLSKLVSWLVSPISKVKGTSDATAVLQMMRALRKGHSVCFFPEGSRTFSGETLPIHPTTAKMIQRAGVPLVTYRISGGYLTSPRWGKKLRRGGCSGQFIARYTAEELKTMTAEEIGAIISRDLYENAFDTQKTAKIKYRCGALAEGLEEALYTCPLCGETGTLRGMKDHFRCSCGLDVKLDAYGFFQKGTPEGPEPPFATILDWYRWQEGQLAAMLPGDPEAPFFADDEFNLFVVGDDHSDTLAASGLLALYPDRLELADRTFPLTELSELAIIHRKKQESLLFTAEGVNYEISSPQRHASRSKYHTLFQLLKAQA